MSMKQETTSALKAMLMKGSGYDQKTVRAALDELKARGEPTPSPAMIMGGRREENPKAPPRRPKMKMNKGGYANCGASVPPTQKSSNKK